MISRSQIACTSLMTLLLQACNAGPDTPRPTNPSPQTVGSQKPTLAANDKYAGLLQALSQRDPTTEAQQAMAQGERSLMGYYAGRGGLKFPGLSPQQQADQRCSLKVLEGLGDVIYSENHLKYRVALRKFAKSYNAAMLPACL